MRTLLPLSEWEIKCVFDAALLLLPTGGMLMLCGVGIIPVASVMLHGGA